MHQISPKAKIRSRFMILCQLSLNGLLFIFPPPLLYKPSLSFILKHTKNPLSSPLLSSNEVEQSCHILIFLRLKVLSETHSFPSHFSFPPPLGLLPRVSSTVWILHEGIILFLSQLFFLCFHDENLGLKYDNNYLNSLEYV